MWKSYPTKYVKKMLKFLKRKKVSIPDDFSISTIEDLVYFNGGTTSVSRELYKQIIKMRGKKA